MIGNRVLRLVARAGIVAALALLTLWVAVGAAPPNDPNANDMSVWPATYTAALGGSVDVTIAITDAELGYAGWQAAVEYDSTKVTFVPQGTRGVTYQYNCEPLCATATDTLVGGNIREVSFGAPSGPSPLASPLANIRFTCGAAAAVASLTLDPANTATLDAAGVGVTTSLHNGSITCNYSSDLQVTKAASSPVVAGGTVTYTSTIVNGGPNPSPAVVIADPVPTEKIVHGTPGVSAGCLADGTGCSMVAVPNPVGVTETVNGVGTAANCAWFEAFNYPGFGVYRNLVICDYSGVIVPPGGVVIMKNDVIVVTIVADVPLSDAGKTEANVVLSGDLVGDDPDASDQQPACGQLVALGLLAATPDNSVGCVIDVASLANITITKAGPAQILQGNSGTYTVNLSWAGGSPPSAVTLTDPVPAGFTVGVPTSTTGTCSVAGQLVTCNVVNAATPMPASVTVTIPFTCADAGTMDNTATVAWATQQTKDSNIVETTCLPPYNGMVKDARPDLPGLQNTANLWLCKALDAQGHVNPDCHLTSGTGGAQIGKGILQIADLIFLHGDVDSPNDSDLLPEGLAAYEEQIKYNHDLVSVHVADAGADGIDNDNDCGNNDSNGDGILCDCITIGNRASCDWNVDEADESVIEGPRGNITCTTTILTENWIMFGCVSLGQALGNPQPVNLWLKTITITPQPDLFQRIRPTKDNGIVTSILDENCEVADMYASEPWPDTLPGGLTPDCGDMTLTIRMLEGDVNLDCVVDVQDEQMEAYRYGSSFGLLLYNPFYDLEPKWTDNDIDIKDVQFVFGRNGSMCQHPIPDDQAVPSPAIPDP